MKKRIVLGLLKLFYRDKPFMFAQGITFHGRTEFGDAAGQVQNCAFIRDGA